MRLALSLFLLLHGAAHLVGFLTPFGLTPATAHDHGPVSSGRLLLGGRVVLTTGEARAGGLLWLALAVAFGVVAVAVWNDTGWWRPALVAVTLASLTLSVLWWPDSRIGVAIDVALLLLVAALAAGWRPAALA